MLVLVDLHIHNLESEPFIPWIGSVGDYAGEPYLMYDVCNMAWAQEAPILISTPLSTHLEICRVLNGRYGGALVAFSEYLVLSLKRNTQCLELCRVTLRTGNIIGDDATPALLCVEDSSNLHHIAMPQPRQSQTDLDRARMASWAIAVCCERTSSQ